MKKDNKGSIKRHRDSHLDHALTEAQIGFILNVPAEDGAVEVQTVMLPDHLGTVPCGLHGPTMGDMPVPESEITYAVRGERNGESRLVDRPARGSRLVTIVSGPHDGLGCVLFTAFGGPQAPQEPFEDDSEGSREFWKQHALSSTP